MSAKGEGVRYKQDAAGPALLLLDDEGSLVAVPKDVLDALERFAVRILRDYGLVPQRYPSALEVLKWMREHGWATALREDELE